jgi:Protein of unknown function (DUF3631)
MSDKFTLNAVPISRQSWAVILQSGDQRFIHQINLRNAKARQDYINRVKFKFMHISREDLTAEINRIAAELTPAEIEANIQGKSINLSAPQPWPESVDSAEVLNQISQMLSRHMVLPIGAADAIALWTAHTHCFQAFNHTPRLHITSPERQCGKTTLLRILGCLVPKPLRVKNVSHKAIFQVVEQHSPVILIDKAESFIFDNDELCDILVAGHERDDCAIRYLGDEKELRTFAVFSPAVISGIGAIPGSLQDQSIPIRLFRAKPGELCQQFDSRKTLQEENLRRKLARFAADHFQQIKDSIPTMPPSAYNRLADNWRPLFAIAEIASSDWPDRVRAAYVALVDQRDQDPQDIGVMLLADIRQIFTELHGIDRILSSGLVQALNAMTDRPWSQVHKGRPASQIWLARKLGAFDIYPGTIRVEEKNAKGYYLTAFCDAFERYVGKSKSHNVTTPENIDVSSTFQAVTSPDRVADQKVPNTLQNKPLLRCDVSNAQNKGLTVNSVKPQPQKPLPQRPQPPRPQPPRPQLPRPQPPRLQVQKPVMPWPHLQKQQPQRPQKLNCNPFMAKGLRPGTALPRREDSG